MVSRAGLETKISALSANQALILSSSSPSASHYTEYTKYIEAYSTQRPTSHTIPEANFSNSREVHHMADSVHPATWYKSLLRSERKITDLNNQLTDNKKYFEK
jgi:hypothetical protein